jgi:hypothetical protein
MAMAGFEVEAWREVRQSALAIPGSVRSRAPGAAGETVTGQIDCDDVMIF